MSTEYEFETNYRGVAVPAGILSATDDAQEAFQTGVDGALDGAAPPDSMGVGNRHDNGCWAEVRADLPDLSLTPEEA